MESLADRYPTTRALFIHPSKSPVYALPTYQVPLGWRGAPMGRDTASGDFFNISSRLPSKGAPQS